MNHRLVEAILFVQSDPVPLDQLAGWLNTDLDGAERAIAALSQALADRGSGLAVQWVDGGVRLTTHPDLADEIRRRFDRVAPEPLSHASWEVLAIIAYRQPITRLEIEAIRQTSSERAIETLVHRALIEEVGRKEAPGRPILYGTTRDFLQQFGLESLADLPQLREMAEPIA